MKKLLLLCFVIALPGCDQLAYLSEPEVRYRVVTGEYAGIDADLSRLELRLRSFLPSFLSTIEIVNEQGNRIISIGRGSPEPETITYLSETIGAVTLVDEDGEIWFTQDDIVNANPVLDDGRAFVDIGISKVAAARVERLSTARTGRQVSLLQDGVPLMTFVVQAPMSKFMRFSAGNRRQARIIAVLLVSGALSRPLKLERMR